MDPPQTQDVDSRSRHRLYEHRIRGRIEPAKAKVLRRTVAAEHSAAAAVWLMPEALPDVLGVPEVLGIEYLGPDAATIRVQGKTRPGAQWRVSRLLRVRIAESLAAEGIDLPPSTFVRPGAAPPAR